MSARNLRRNSPSRFSLLEILAVLFVPQGLPLGGGEIIYLRVDSSRCKISRKKKRKEKKRREKKVSRASNGVAKCCGDGESFLYAQQKRREELKREIKRGQSERNAALAQKRDGRRKKYGRERERESSINSRRFDLYGYTRTILSNRMEENYSSVGNRVESSERRIRSILRRVLIDDGTTLPLHAHGLSNWCLGRRIVVRGIVRESFSFQILSFYPS